MLRPKNLTLKGNIGEEDMKHKQDPVFDNYTRQEIKSCLRINRDRRKKPPYIRKNLPVEEGKLIFHCIIVYLLSRGEGVTSFLLKGQFPG